MVVFGDRDEIDGAFRVIEAEQRGRHRHRFIGIAGPHLHQGTHDFRIERGADQLGIRAVDDQVFARGDRNLEAAGVFVDIVLQQVRIRRRDRGEFLHADLNHAGQVFNLFLRGADDRFLRLETRHHLHAERQRQQDGYKNDQLRFEIERRKSHLAITPDYASVSFPLQVEPVPGFCEEAEIRTRLP